MTNLWNKSHLAISDLPGSSWRKLMSGELKQLLLSSSPFDLVLIFSPIHVLTRLHKPIPDSIQNFTSLNSKTFCLDDVCHTLESTPVVNDVKARLLAGFVASLVDALFCLLLFSCICCLGECASQPFPASQNNQNC